MVFDHDFLSHYPRSRVNFISFHIVLSIVFFKHGQGDNRYIGVNIRTTANTSVQYIVI